MRRVARWMEWRLLMLALVILITASAAVMVLSGIMRIPGKIADLLAYPLGLLLRGVDAAVNRAAWIRPRAGGSAWRDF